LGLPWKCGRRFGKTSTLVALAIDAALCGQAVGYFAPAYKLSAPTFKALKFALAPIIARVNASSGLIEIEGGGSVEIWSLEHPYAGRSRKYHLVEIDEAAFGRNDLVEVYQSAIAPTLLDYRGRANPRMREIALDKLAAFRISHPHLFLEVEKSAGSWSDVADVGGDDDASWKAAEAARLAKTRTRFMDMDNWRESGAGNPTIGNVAMKGVEYRVVLFRHKKTPTFGYLIIEVDADEDAETFSNVRYATQNEAHRAAWEALCAL
jgi:hypothetical protein